VLGGKPPIGPEESFASVYFDVIWSRHGNRRKAVKRKGDRPFDLERHRRVPAPTPNPEQVLELAQGEIDLEELHAEVRASLADDPVALSVMELGESGITKPRAHAEKLGVGIDVVYAKREKIKERITELAAHKERNIA
jgi:hypothetical protein